MAYDYLVIFQVKLKTGKVKPKADNFTNTTFKSHAIQIKEQLKEEDKSQPTNQRKQSINVSYNDNICKITNNTVNQCLN